MNTYNGYANWETWEAYNIITSFGDTYKMSTRGLVMNALNIASQRMGFENTHLNWRLVDFKEIADKLQGDNNG